MTEYSAEIQARLAQIRKVKEAHENRLLDMPGVNAVGISPKIQNGVRTSEFAIVVEVSEKKPLDALTPEEVIPPEIEGIKTDVVVGGPYRLAVGKVETDDTVYRPVKGGSAITADGRPGTGTLGCIAITTDAAKRPVLLTNEHVLLKATATQHNGEAVGQPNTCSKCSPWCDHTIAHIDRDAVLSGYDPAQPPTAVPGVDGGIASLDMDTEWVAEVISTGQGDGITTEKIMGVHPLTDKDVLYEFDEHGVAHHIYAVHKRGARTLLRQGWVDNITQTSELTYTEPDTGFSRTLRFKDQIKVVSQQNGVAFGLEGDSGSVVLNASSEVVGLLFGVPTTEDPADPNFMVCSVSPIAAVQDQLHIRIADSKEFVGTQKVPKLAAGGAPVHANIAAIDVNRPLPRLLADAQDEVTATPQGKRLAEAAERRSNEIQALVHRNKRVAAVWRRVGGQSWAQEAFSCLQNRQRPFPSELAGRTFAGCVEQMLKILHRYGSPELAADLSTYSPMLLAAAGRSYEELLTLLRASGSDQVAYRRVKLGMSP